MSLSTFSVFYYDYDIDNESKYINFDEGGDELTAEVAIGSYTPTELAVAIEAALNLAGAAGYAVSFNRSTRAFTISAESNFSLLVDTGSTASSAFSIFGFEGADRTGDDEYTGSSSGSIYYPQFILQDHISTDDYQNLVSPSINKSANGRVEVIRFGTEKFMQANIKFITNLVMDDNVIKNNPTGVEDAREFLRYITQKKPFEFMKSVSSRETFQSFILESTPDYKDGTGYKLKELYTKGIPNIFETGNLVFRLLED